MADPHVHQQNYIDRATFDFCGALVIVPYQRRPTHVLLTWVAIATYHTPMTLFHTETDRRIWGMEVQRAVSGRLARMEPIFYKLWAEDRAATRALLCHSRGQEAHVACNNCKEDAGPLRGCVVLRNEYNNRYSNYIVSDRRDCSWSTRYLIEEDNDYVPARESRSPVRRTGVEGQGTYDNPMDLT